MTTTKFERFIQDQSYENLPPPIGGPSYSPGYSIQLYIIYIVHNHSAYQEWLNASFQGEILSNIYTGAINLALMIKIIKTSLHQNIL